MQGQYQEVIVNGEPLYFPYDMSDQAIADVIQNQVVSQTPQKTRTEQIFDRIMYGVREPLNAAAQMAERALPEEVSGAINQADQWLYDQTGGFLGSEQDSFSQRLAEEEAAYQQQYGQEGIDAARLGGSIVGSIPTLALRTPKTLAGVMGLGAAEGTLTPVYDQEADFATAKAQQAGTGAALAGGISALARGLLPKVDVGEAAQLIEEGVQPSVAQSLASAPGPVASRVGKVGQAVEGYASALPLVGDVIQSGKAKAIEEFNEATINRAIRGVDGLPPVDKGLNIGQSAIADAQEKVSKAYDDAALALQNVDFGGLPAIRTNKLERQLKMMSPKARTKFRRTIKNIVDSQGDFDQVPWQRFQRIDSELNELATRGKGSALASDKEFGEALETYLNAVRTEVGKNNPGYRKAVNKANRAHANLVRVEDAANRAIAQEGVFTPKQLLDSIKRMDRSARKRQSAAGKARMQDWAQAGQKVLGSTYQRPDPTRRLLYGMGALGAGYISPAIPIAATLGAAAYSRPVQRGALNYLTGDGSARQIVDQLLRQGGPLAIPGLTREYLEDE